MEEIKADNDETAPTAPIGDNVANAVISRLDNIGINEHFVSSLFSNRLIRPWPGKLGKYIGLQVFGESELFHAINIINGSNMEFFTEPQPLPTNIRTFSSDPDFQLSKFLRFYNVRGFQDIIIEKKDFNTGKYNTHLSGQEHFYGYINKETKRFKIVGYKIEPIQEFYNLGISSSAFELVMNDDNSALYGNSSIYKYEGYDMRVDLNEIHLNLKNLIENSKYHEFDENLHAMNVESSNGSGKDSYKRDLWFNIEIEMINRVDSKTQCFDALFTIHYEWTLTTSDFYKYAAMTEDKKKNYKESIYEPDWKPNMPRFPNAVEIKQLESSQIEIQSLPRRIRYVTDGKGNRESMVLNKADSTKRMFYATQTISVRGTFTERLELKNFPFDCQDLKVYIETNILDRECNVHPLSTVTGGLTSPRGSPPPGGPGFENVPSSDNNTAHNSTAHNNSGSFEAMDEVLRVSKMNDESVSEWHFSESPKWDLHYTCRPDVMHATDNFEAIIVFNVKAERAWAIYFWRIFLINFMINLICLIAFTFDIDNDFGSRLEYCLTLLLTDVAYSLVVAESLPTLKYLTILDQVILASYFYICLITVESGVIGYIYWRFEIDRDIAYYIDSIMFGVFALMLVLVTVVLVIGIKGTVIPRELKKLKHMWQLNDIEDKSNRMFVKDLDGGFKSYNQELIGKLRKKLTDRSVNGMDG